MIEVARFIDKTPIPFDELKIDRAAYDEEGYIFIDESLSRTRTYARNLWQGMSNKAEDARALLAERDRHDPWVRRMAEVLFCDALLARYPVPGFNDEDEDE